MFNNSSGSQSSSQKHLGVILDNKLILHKYLKMVFLKTNITLGLLQKLQNLLPRFALITIYKAFVRPHIMVMSFIINLTSFHQKLESIQYNARLAITGAIRGTSKERLYQELNIEPLQLRRWYRNLRMFYQIYQSKSPQYLF